LNWLVENNVEVLRTGTPRYRLPVSAVV
jgi:hypothetical protein